VNGTEARRRFRGVTVSISGTDRTHDIIVLITILHLCTELSVHLII
jgi:hypothetical protein